jgi:hypothetical protein
MRQLLTLLLGLLLGLFPACLFYACKMREPKQTTLMRGATEYTIHGKLTYRYINAGEHTWYDISLRHDWSDMICSKCMKWQRDTVHLMWYIDTSARIVCDTFRPIIEHSEIKEACK